MNVKITNITNIQQVNEIVDFIAEQLLDTHEKESICFTHKNYNINLKCDEVGAIEEIKIDILQEEK